MTIIERLAAATGAWHGNNRLHDPHTGSPEDSQEVASLVSVLGGLFLRFDYHWSYQGKAQEGSILIGCERETARVSAYWIDTWHMGEKVMTLTGPNDQGEQLGLRGSYTAPPGPDWGWRIEFIPSGPEALQLRMRNITPEGEEQPAVEMTLRPVPKLSHH
jgi:hypothetical protein